MGVCHCSHKAVIWCGTKCGANGAIMGKLTALKVKALATKGAYEDGDGLRLIVRDSGSKSWVLRYQVGGKRRDLGLGGYPGVSLQEARALAQE